MKYVFLILFYFIPVVSGYTGIFSILDEKYIDNISNLPENTDLKPDRKVMPSYEWFSEHCEGDSTINCVFGWIDLVGFRDMVQIGDTSYINKSPADNAIVQYKTFIRVNSRHFLDHWDSTLHVYQDGDNVVAHLVAVAVLVQISSDGYRSYQNETRDFYDVERAPLLYPSIQSGSVNITEYNNSFNPKTVISLNIPGNISKITYRYGNETLTHYLSQGHVEQTAKGVYFLNLTKVDSWTANTKTLQQLNNWVIIPNSSRPDYSQLSIDLSNPYETMTIESENYSYERITYNSGSTFSDPLLMFVSMLATFFILSIIVIRRA